MSRVLCFPGVCVWNDLYGQGGSGSAGYSQNPCQMTEQSKIVNCSSRGLTGKYIQLQKLRRGIAMTRWRYFWSLLHHARVLETPSLSEHLAFWNNNERTAIRAVSVCGVLFVSSLWMLLVEPKSLAQLFGHSDKSTLYHRTMLLRCRKKELCSRCYLQVNFFEVLIYLCLFCFPQMYVLSIQ